MFYLIRHGETDYSDRNTKIYKGFGVNLSPLSENGIQQIKETAKDLRLTDADIILSSPYTRALQTAAILSKEIGIEIAVETDLHEWVANKNYIYDEDEKAEKSYQQYVDNQGEYQDGVDEVWESKQMMEERVLAVLKKYSQYKKVIVACHGMMIHAVTKKYHPHNGEIIEFEL